MPPLLVLGLLAVPLVRPVGIQVGDTVFLLWSEYDTRKPSEGGYRQGWNHFQALWPGPDTVEAKDTEGNIYEIDDRVEFAVVRLGNWHYTVQWFKGRKLKE